MYCFYSANKHYELIKKVHFDIKYIYNIKKIKKIVLKELIFQYHLNKTSNLNHYIIRIGDGINFKNQPHKVWGLVNNFKGNVKKMKSGDIIWFLTNKNKGGIIEVAEYKCYYDRNEDLIGINTYTNNQQKWLGNKDWNIQIHYKTIMSVYNSKMNKVLLQGATNIFKYDEKIKNKLKENFDIDLYYEYALLKTQSQY